ncbi:hypothetical protein SYNPS1DRAFT_30076 [Syncephalis pseudoplumigaleata]|uniref:PWWP domain-containing protein n=1 Tax=Syncephalis pseudoplumigaleata TaxID=1712513 RepID=A0A4P9YW70_9FUNG|nr:hypothetical protein SYNPS1DRAFT_30076 [Syncephalis pseudoplumigaleata]|eukprot:RKP24154.1 hypothetical protein SYNPS1DRAFT_30076 [Syncephalis pseudoplumigaleata]
MTAPGRSHAKRRIVFVDPDDPSAPFWWPAMVVPESEIDVFRQTMTSDIQEPGANEHLVCYFEDSSFSVVHERELVPFSPDKSPYTDYLRGPHSHQFKRDRAVQLATLYWETGIVPRSFTWARDTERKVFQGDPMRPLRKETDARRPSAGNGTAGKASTSQHRKAHSVSSLSGGKHGKSTTAASQGQRAMNGKSHAAASSTGAPLPPASNGLVDETMEATSVPLARRHTASAPMPTTHESVAGTLSTPEQMSSYARHAGTTLDNGEAMLRLWTWAHQQGPSSHDMATPGHCTHCQTKVTHRMPALLCLGCHDLLGEPSRFQSCTGRTAKKPCLRRQHPYEAADHHHHHHHHLRLRLWGPEEHTLTVTVCDGVIRRWLAGLERMTVEVLTGLVPVTRRERWRRLQLQQGHRLR